MLCLRREGLYGTKLEMLIRHLADSMTVNF